ncbi:MULTISPECIES: glycoside hydrolase family 66 protein [Streptococcus]|uniref:glycoside hydrolase family 66 protein n=1 Tax=Streptococcus TaxID=1301 RepID=UPI0003E20156|nr:MULTISPECIES: glycoside hydrolase family 66 protein [Streptococcus]ETS92905.1 putative dextranase [Streptococcus sp. SR4]MCA6656446.1 dextranase [Streptococcus salivarius]MCA6658218.1 dextranase [Streptococcus salivarius]MDU0880963.1 glycoside hydrolase family 66 protein [Streptococcus salivarius]
MSKKVASTKLLSGLFVAGGVLGMNQVTKADNVVSSEATKPVITTEADNLVVVPTEAVAPVATTEVGPSSAAVATDTATTATASTIFSQAVPAESASSETLVASEALAPESAAVETITSSSDNATEAGRHSTAQVTPVTEVTEQNLNGDAYLTDPETTKAAYSKTDGDINYSVVVSNPTAETKTMTVNLTLQHASEIIGQDNVDLTLAAGASAKVSNLTVASEWLTNNTGYLVTISVNDKSGSTLSSKRAGLSVEDDWTVFPRYGIVAGSPTDQNSILVKNLEAYRKELELMKSMNINSYFFYDAYNEATDPFPEGVDSFVQKWNTWSHTQVDTKAIKELVDQVHKSGAVAMLYNMISADSNPKNPALPLAALAYNFYDSFGKKGEPMTYTIGDNPTQVYYDPANPDWQKYIAGVMKSAMDRMGFDGWQGDTIGDNRVTDYEHRNSTDEADSHMMSDSYASFINAMKDLIGEKYYITINDVNGGNDDKLAKARQDVVYNELWTNGGSVIPGRMQVAYGDLKARIDMVRNKTGKSLIVGAYMEEPGIDYTVPGGKATNGAGKDALAGKPLQADATLLVDATVAAAGGYHMSIAALANANAALNVLQSAYYPTQYLSVAKDTIRKLYNYQQFITAYENLLRGEGVTNSTQSVSTKNAAGEILSKDVLGVTGDQVWTFAKSGKGFSTVQMINMMGINAGWHNEEGYADNKTPDAQENLTVRLSLAGKTAQEAAKIADQVYVTSPDDWATSSMKKAQASLETDENGQPVLVISVPKLTLWNMLYIKEDTTATPVEPVVLKPVTNRSGKKVDNTVTSEASSVTAKSENTTVNKGSEAPTDTKPSVEAPKLDETTKPAPSVDELVNSAAVPVAIAVSETAHDKKDDNSVSNTDQGTVASDSTTPASEAASTAASTVSSEVSESVTVSSEASETENSSVASISESAISTTTAISESHAVVEPVASLTESESQASTSLVSETTSTIVSVAPSEVSESTTVSSKVSETDIISEASTSETSASESENSISTVVSESEVVEEPAVSLTESESQVSTSEVTSAISETVSTSEEVILDGLSENINSWNRLSVAPRVSETLPSTSETITEAASLFSNYARYSETASSESHSMVAASSEVSIEKLAVSILKDTEGGLYDATTIRNIVEMIDSITTNVSYTRSSRQDLVNTASSDNTYNGSQDLNLASKTTTQAGEKGTTEDLKATIAKTAKSHKWGEHAVAILTAIVLAGAATLAALRNFLMSKKVDK